MKTITFSDFITLTNRDDIKIEIDRWNLFIVKRASFFSISGDDDCPIYYHAMLVDNEVMNVYGNSIIIKVLESKEMGVKKEISLEVLKITPYLF